MNTDEMTSFFTAQSVMERWCWLLGNGVNRLSSVFPRCMLIFSNNSCCNSHWYVDYIIDVQGRLILMWRV